MIAQAKFIAMNLAEEIAAFVAHARREEMVREAARPVKRSVIDAVGVVKAGQATAEGKALQSFFLDYAMRAFSKERFSRRLTAEIPLSAFALGSLAHVLDYDDVGCGTQGHPSAVLMPVCLSLCSALNLTGADLIGAYVVGVETWSKISQFVPGLHLRGWHPTGVLGTVGAAAAAAYLLKLSQKEVQMAIGISCSMASGLVQNFGSITKAFHAGNAAHQGILSAFMAYSGFQSMTGALDGNLGFCTVYGERSSGCETIDALRFGKPYAIASPGPTLKKYPSCAHTHRVVDGILALKKEIGFNSNNIELIECITSPNAKRVLFHCNPLTSLEAKFCMEFAAAAAAVTGDLNLRHYALEMINNSVIREIMKKINVTVHADWKEGVDIPEKRPDRVIVKFEGGATRSIEICHPKGHPDNPLSDEEVVQKYKDCAMLGSSERQSEEILDMLWNLESLKEEDLEMVHKYVAIGLQHFE